LPLIRHGCKRLSVRCSGPGANALMPRTAIVQLFLLEVIARDEKGRPVCIERGTL
jgi:hypothetical protein